MSIDLPCSRLPLFLPSAWLFSTRSMDSIGSVGRWAHSSSKVLFCLADPRQAPTMSRRGIDFARPGWANSPYRCRKITFWGLDSQKWEEGIGFYRPSPAGGLVHGGAWYSPLVTLAFKLPLGTIALILGSTVAGVCRPAPFALRRIFMSILVAVFFLMLAAQTGLNWAARYSIPLIPFLALLIGQPIEAAWNRRAWKWLMMACLGWNLLAVLLSLGPTFSRTAMSLSVERKVPGTSSRGAIWTGDRIYTGWPSGGSNILSEGP